MTDERRLQEIYTSLDDVRIDTAELRLTLAAERLFAEQGVAGVALRQVVQAAGQRNMSAAHYHFGSRDGLLRAVLSLRMPQINARRSELLARTSPSGGEPDLRFLVEVFVLPLAELLQPREGGNYYLRFLEQYRFFPAEFDLIIELAPASFSMGDSIRKVLSYLPPRIVEVRLKGAWSMIVSTLAYAEQRIGSGEIPIEDLALIASDLVDTMTAALAAPVSPSTLSAL